MRRLVHIPIIHSEADMGSARDTLRRTYIETRGQEAWDESRRAIAEFWDALEDATASLDLDFSKVRVYQDGLPVCGIEDKIVRDLSGQGVPNYRIVLNLMERGAVLEGTEDPKLLRREYELLMRSLQSADDKTKIDWNEAAHTAQLEEVLDSRDRFIANRIDATLLPDETGILFLGALHRAVDHLPSDIKVVSLSEMLEVPLRDGLIR